MAVRTPVDRPTRGPARSAPAPLRRGPLDWVREHIIALIAAARVRLHAAAEHRRGPLLVQQSQRALQLPVETFSLDAWLHPCGAAGMCASLGLSLQIGVMATLGATVLGTLVAFALARHRFRGRAATNLLIFLPMATPEVVMGSCLLTLFVGMGLPLGHVDDPHRPHHVLPVVRGRHRQGTHRRPGPAAGAGRGRPLRQRAADVPARHAAPGRAGHRGGARCCLRPLVRRLHHHELQRRLVVDHVPHVRLGRGAAAAHRCRSTSSARSCSWSR